MAESTECSKVTHKSTGSSKTTHESTGSSKATHEDTKTLLSGIKLLEENIASCVSEEEFGKIFEPFLAVQPDLSITKIYSFFYERMRKANIAKEMNVEELDEMFTKKSSLTESCKQFENTIAWRPSGNVEADLNIKYNAEQKKYQQKLEKEIYEAKLTLDKLIDEVNFKRNKIDRSASELPELHSKVDEICSRNQDIKEELLNSLLLEEQDVKNL